VTCSLRITALPHSYGWKCPSLQRAPNEKGRAIMRRVFVMLVIISFAGTAIAQDLSNSREFPEKYTPTVTYVPPAEPKQGGDTVFDATNIPGLPYSDTGNTCGYTNDYDETCPYTGSTSPDVVYSFTPGSDGLIGVDLCGSQYDTKTYIYDSGLNLVACNDDFYVEDPCGVYVSRIENAPLMAGETYFIVIDGYGGDFGAYTLDIYPHMEWCYEPYPDSEGEPPLPDDYVDYHNGGCDTPPDYPFQAITGDADGNAFLSGRSGWYTVGGAMHRDTDWFLLTMGQEASLEITACSMEHTVLAEIGPQDCGSAAVLQSITSIIWVEETMVITGYAPGAVVWLRISPQHPEPPLWYDEPYGYNVWFTGLLEPAVATEVTTWSTVKALYR
jgi:hypothetical protein